MAASGGGTQRVGGSKAWRRTREGAGHKLELKPGQGKLSEWDANLVRVHNGMNTAS